MKVLGVDDTFPALLAKRGQATPSYLGGREGGEKNILIFFMFKDERGVTMVEVLVALGIFILVGGAAMQIFLTSLKDKDIVFEQLNIQSQGRKAQQDFINELRGASVSSIGGYPLVKVEPNELIFYSNLDGDIYRERVHYYLDGNQLVKGVLKPAGDPLKYEAENEVTSTVVDRLNNGESPLFYYYGQNYSGTTTALTSPKVTEVKMVKIKFQLERNPSLAPAALNLEATAEIRNLKGN